MPLWAGRFSKEIDELTNDYNSSIAVDSRMYKEDIQGSIAHVTMLGAVGILKTDEWQAIAKELEKMLIEICDGDLEISYEYEDIHSFVEGELTKRLGELGKKLHTGRSRNDQVATDLRLYLKNQIKEIKSLIIKALRVMQKIAQGEYNSLMPGYTHLQRAQGITFGHFILAYAEMLLRDYDRLKDTEKRMNICPLGSAALAGTTYPLDRFLSSELLGFSAPCRNSLDGVSDRDFCLELSSNLAILQIHLSRLAEELILFSSMEYGFISFDDAYSTGSSIMPQKKNPDLAELIRGKSGRSIGSMINLFTMLKGLPLAYNKDMQEDKEAIFNSVDTAKASLKILAPMLETMTINREKLFNATIDGFVNATDLADYLVIKGLAFRDAYKIVGSIVADAIEKNIGLEEYSLDELKEFSSLIEKDVYESIKVENCVAKRQTYGGTAPEQVLERAKELANILNELEV